MLENYLIIGIIGYVFSWIITKEYIFNFVRKWMNFSNFTNYLFNCPYCMSIWTGLFLGLIWPLNYFDSIVIHLMVSTSFSYLISRIMGYLSRNEITID